MLAFKRNAIGATILVAVLAASGPAHALSCVFPNLAQTFNAYAEAPETYVMAHGTLTPDGPLPPAKEGVPRQAQFSFSGNLIGITRDSPVELPVTVRTRCLSVWCGGFPGNAPVAMFLQRSEGDHILTIGPCPGEVKENPTTAQIDALRQCLSQGKCGEAELESFRH